jgi:hypothetical protein
MCRFFKPGGLSFVGKYTRSEHAPKVDYGNGIVWNLKPKLLSASTQEYLRAHLEDRVGLGRAGQFTRRLAVRF